MAEYAKELIRIDNENLTKVRDGRVVRVAVDACDTLLLWGI